MATDYNLLGSAQVLKELQEGRTRELLLLLQDKPVPEAVDPLNLKSGLSNDYEQNGDDYAIFSGDSTATREPDDNPVSTDGKFGLKFNPNKKLTEIRAEISSNAANFTNASLLDSSGNVISDKDVSGKSFGDEVVFTQTFNKGKEYFVTLDDGADLYDLGADSDASYPYTSELVDITASWSGGSETTSEAYNFINIDGVPEITSATITDQFTAPTTEPADFKAWNAIQAQDVTTGGSTSANPVEFEILDSSDTVLNSTRIPKARIADEPFTMRNRVYSEDAGSDGQSDYQIATTGDGGHFGIPILTVVSVKKNGSLLDSANWSFDPDTDTVTIDTSNVTIASGDTIDIKYDFDVFDSTLQPRVYLSRESGSETSPSISHFRYEYVI